MKRILVIGAGMVAGPLVEYLLDQPEFFVEVADIVADKPRLLVGRHPRGKAGAINLDDETMLQAAVKPVDLVVSLAPYAYHPKIAACCLKHKKHLVTASYVTPAMADFDAEARRAGLVFLNEIGLDPGIDHMESMRIIHDIHERGGLVQEFISYCGGLPAPEADTNPWGYKFSWSPVGVLRAGNNSAKYFKDGEEVVLPSERLFDSCPAIRVEGLPEFEGYPNRDSLPYIRLYGIPETKTMFRGTLRYNGWCRTIKAVRGLGWLDETPMDWKDATLESFLQGRMKVPAGTPVKNAVGRALSLPEDSDVVQRLEWLGLFSPTPIPAGIASPLEVLAGLMADRLKYAPGERDMVVLQHTFVAAFPPQGRKEKIVSTLVDFGVPHGDSSMARTVGLPAAIGAGLILQGKIKSAGVQIPVLPEIYEPVLEELKRRGIAFREERRTV
jgi:saccharopine dehydrogenase (NADP+, L-glutamate forming)